jgi:hypothetical protein
MNDGDEQRLPVKLVITLLSPHWLLILDISNAASGRMITNVMSIITTLIL